MKEILPRKRTFKIEMVGWPMIDVFVYRRKQSKERHKGWVFASVMTVPDAYTGELDYYGIDQRVDFYSRRITPRKIANHVKDLLLKTFAHEIDECLRIDGKRVLPDPHRKKR